MRIPSAALRATILVSPALGNQGDGDTFGPAVKVKASVETKTMVSSDDTGQTLTAWTRARIRPTVKVTGADGRRPILPGDKVTVDGRTRLVEVVAVLRGPGTQVSGFELVAGDG